MDVTVLCVPHSNRNDVEDAARVICGTHRTVTARMWHTQESHSQNVAHIRQSRPDSGLGIKAKDLKTF